MIKTVRLADQDCFSYHPSQYIANPHEGHVAIDEFYKDSRNLALKKAGGQALASAMADASFASHMTRMSHEQSMTQMQMRLTPEERLLYSELAKDPARISDFISWFDGSVEATLSVLANSDDRSMDQLRSSKGLALSLGAEIWGGSAHTFSPLEQSVTELYNTLDGDTYDVASPSPKLSVPDQVSPLKSEGELLMRIETRQPVYDIAVKSCDRKMHVAKRATDLVALESLPPKLRTATTKLFATRFRAQGMPDAAEGLAEQERALLIAVDEINADRPVRLRESLSYMVRFPVRKPKSPSKQDLGSN